MQFSFSKVIFVLSDGLRYDTATNEMGFLMHLVEQNIASLYKVIGELPSISRPMYETLHTGVPPIEHGIVSNRVVRLSNMPNIFQLAVQAGKTTAAIAYSWISELYNRAPFEIEDREVDDPSLPIQHGRFYTEDDYPDVECFSVAAMLVRKYFPDYLLVLPSGMDFTGETYGSDTPEYRTKASQQDLLMANLIPEWLEKGYHILVSSDHGMNADRSHGGATAEVREVPLFLIQKNRCGEGINPSPISMLQIAPTICTLLGLPIPNSMKMPSIVC
ncbi:MAG: alkaline phosphatase family protein [Anaerolineales bacterium]|nr:alkaline phosphatase family protein [Anaerolineales bacterium]